MHVLRFLEEYIHEKKINFFFIHVLHLQANKMH